MENIIDAVSYEENIIQLQLRNVPKHPMIIAKIFTILSECWGKITRNDPWGSG